VVENKISFHAGKEREVKSGFGSSGFGLGAELRESQRVQLNRTVAFPMGGSGQVGSEGAIGKKLPARREAGNSQKKKAE
jgi:hypothetical protein